MIRMALGAAAFAVWVGIEVNRFIVDGIERALTGDTPRRHW